MCSFLGLRALFRTNGGRIADFIGLFGRQDCTKNDAGENTKNLSNVISLWNWYIRICWPCVLTVAKSGKTSLSTSDARTGSSEVNNSTSGAGCVVDENLTWLVTYFTYEFFRSKDCWYSLLRLFCRYITDPTTMSKSTIKLILKLVINRMFWTGLEPATLRFSVLCSTNWATRT